MIGTCTNFRREKNVVVARVQVGDVVVSETMPYTKALKTFKDNGALAAEELLPALAEKAEEQWGVDVSAEFDHIRDRATQWKKDNQETEPDES